MATIRMKLNDGVETKEHIFRKIYQGKNYAQLVERFYSFRGGMRWGELEQLKGKERIVLHRFGNKQ